MSEYKIVTKGSDDGTFIKGDHIIIYDNGDIGCLEAGGFILANEVPYATKGMLCEIDKEYINRKKQNLKAKLKALDKKT